MRVHVSVKSRLGHATDVFNLEHRKAPCQQTPETLHRDTDKSPQNTQFNFQEWN